MPLEFILPREEPRTRCVELVRSAPNSVRLHPLRTFLDRFAGIAMWFMGVRFGMLRVRHVGLLFGFACILWDGHALAQDTNRMAFQRWISDHPDVTSFRMEAVSSRVVAVQVRTGSTSTICRIASQAQCATGPDDGFGIVGQSSGSETSLLLRKVQQESDELIEWDLDALLVRHVGRAPVGPLPSLMTSAPEIDAYQPPWARTWQQHRDVEARAMRRGTIAQSQTPNETPSSRPTIGGLSAAAPDWTRFFRGSTHPVATTEIHRGEFSLVVASFDSFDEQQPHFIGIRSRGRWLWGDLSADFQSPRIVAVSEREGRFWVMVMDGGAHHGVWDQLDLIVLGVVENRTLETLGHLSVGAFVLQHNNDDTDWREEAAVWFNSVELGASACLRVRDGFTWASVKRGAGPWRRASPSSLELVDSQLLLPRPVGWWRPGWAAVRLACDLPSSD